MPLKGGPPSGLWIVGYGNLQRRDDGVGPYIVNRLQPFFDGRSDVHLLILHQLEPDVIDELKNAHMILFVDATTKASAEGRHWIAIQPEPITMPCLSHEVAPPLILGWLQCLYHRCPPAWMVSVEGNDFSFGSGLSPRAQKWAEQVIGEITAFVLTCFAGQGRNTRINRMNQFPGCKPKIGGRHAYRKGYTRHRRRPGPGGYPSGCAGK